MIDFQPLLTFELLFYPTTGEPKVLNLAEKVRKHLTIQVQSLNSFSFKLDNCGNPKTNQGNAKPIKDNQQALTIQFPERNRRIDGFG